MQDNLKHGDIFYVLNGHWYGLYTESNEPSIIVYKNDLSMVVKLKDFSPLKYGEKLIKVEENHFDNMDISIIGNIFKLAEESIEEAKIIYEKTLETCVNLEDLILVKD